MVTAEDLRVLLDDTLFLTGVERSIRSNAIEYLLREAEGQSYDEINRIAQGNAAQYERLLNLRQAVRDDSIEGVKLNSALDQAGISQKEQQAKLDALVASVQDHKNAVISDADSLKAVADLGNVALDVKIDDAKAAAAAADAVPLVP